MRQRGDVGPDTNESTPPSLNPITTRWHQVLAGIVLACATITPVFVSLSGHDLFRLPKQYLLYAFVIVAAAAADLGFVFRRLELDADARQRLRLPAAILAGGSAWTLLSAFFSTNRRISVDACIWAAALALLFLVAIYALRAASIPALTLLYVPALVNATIVFLQGFEIWNPWVFDDVSVRMTKNALLGNPDDVGVYLAAPALLAATLALHAKRLRFAHAAVAAWLTFGVLITETLTAVAALAAAFVALAAHRWKRALPAILVALVIAGGVLTMYEPLAERITKRIKAVPERRWNEVLSGRLIAFAAAWQMFRDHPVAGVGPGCFKYHYMRYKVAAEADYPGVAIVSGERARNFGEVHNDHLQIMAEAGIIGYAFVLALLALVASSGRRAFHAPSDERAEFAHAFSVPAIVLMATAMLAQFPLQLAAPACTYVVLGAVCLAWRRKDA